VLCMRASSSSFSTTASHTQNQGPCWSWRMPHFITVSELNICVAMQASS
jgi:hypothetical protein